MTPEPLPSGFRLAERFTVTRLLGRGAFGIVYLAEDEQRQDRVVVKELAPEGSHRDSTGLLNLRSGSSTPAILRQRFLDEAHLLIRLRCVGVLPVRSAWVQNGTGYYATEFIPGAVTLDDRIQRDRTLSVSAALEIFGKLLDTIEEVHSAGILHRDIKPSNILVGPGSADVHLVDFGSAREFLSDASQTHTVMYTPGFAPPEQLSERARRGPATDLFALSATLYQMLVGTPPADTAERIAGHNLVPVHRYRPDIPPNLSTAIETGLSLNYAARPQSAQEFRELLESTDPITPIQTVAELDDVSVRIQKFTFQKRACPNCSEPLDAPKPLKKWGCPVCRKGTIRKRRIDPALCPCCKNGKVTVLPNRERLSICPSCTVGTLQYRKKSLLSKEEIAQCSGCSAEFAVESGSLTDLASGETRTLDDWRESSGRAPEVAVCRECRALFDVLGDGRWSLVHGSPVARHRVLYPDEWALIAHGFEPGQGNAECDLCNADYYIEGEHLTLIDAPHDPHGFANHYVGRLLTLEDARWVGSGKESPHLGLVCGSCGTEFDQDGDYVRLVKTPNRLLIKHAAEPRTAEDWHRIARGLPTIDKEEDLEQKLQSALLQSYLAGEIGFGSPDIVWTGPAIRRQDGVQGTLRIDERTITFGGLLKKNRQPRDAVLSAEAGEEFVRLHYSGEREPVEFEIEPATLAVSMKSGERTLTIGPFELAARLRSDQAEGAQ